MLIKRIGAREGGRKSAIFDAVPRVHGLPDIFCDLILGLAPQARVSHRLFVQNNYFLCRNELIKKNLNIIVRKIIAYTRRLAYDKVSFIRGDISTSILGNFPRRCCL